MSSAFSSALKAIPSCLPSACSTSSSVTAPHLDQDLAEAPALLLLGGERLLQHRRA